jgi:hypothetical protein
MPLKGTRADGSYSPGDSHEKQLAESAARREAQNTMMHSSPSYMYKEGRLFMGQGNFSSARCYELHRQLDKAFENLSNLQQLGLFGHEVDKSEVNDLEGKLEFTARCLYTALTGVIPPRIERKTRKPKKDKKPCRQPKRK